MNKRLIAMVLVLGMLLSCTGYATGEETAAPAPRNAAEDLLLIVDFQNVYLPGYDWACPDMPEAMANTISILINPEAPDYLMTAYIAPTEPVGRWQDYNEAYKEINENAFLSEMAEAMLPFAEEGRVAEKTTYSSMDCDAVVEAMKGKKAVVLTGVVAECCVLATMLDAIDMGYEVVYLYDCIAGCSEENEAMIKALAESFAPVHTTVMSSEEYLDAIGAGSAWGGEDDEAYYWSDPDEKYVAELLAPLKEIHDEKEAEAYMKELWPLLSSEPLPEGELSINVDEHDMSYHMSIDNEAGRNLYTANFLSNGVIQEIGYNDLDDRKYSGSRMDGADLDETVWEQAKGQLTEQIEKLAPGVLELLEPLKVEDYIDVGDKQYLYIYAMPLDPAYDVATCIIAVLDAEGNCELMDYSCYGAG